MIRLAVFCDGTWNGLRMPDLTNVARLARSVLRDPPDGVPQVVFYDEGVGTTTGVSRVNNRLESTLGGAFGAGLDRKIEQAYRFIVLNYEEPDDEIFIFGFSRGAYTARSLCGLIRKCGILKQEHMQRVPEAIALYRNHQLHPAGPECQEFRRLYARNEVVGAEDLPKAKGQPGGEKLLTQTVRQNQAIRIRYLGLWDTVGSLGIPDRFSWIAGFNRRYRFHDTAASRLIESLRHAIAADEDRRTFAAAPFSNIRELNIGAAREISKGTGSDAQVTDPDKPGYIPYDRRRYQQKWFPGDHGAVGGGNPEPGLSSSALLWVAEGAKDAGLMLDEGPHSELALARDRAKPLSNWRVGKRPEDLKPAWAVDMLGMVGGYRSRSLAIGEDEVHPSARERWERIKTYRPKVFEPFTGEVKMMAYRYVELVVGPPFRVVLVLALLVAVLALLWAAISLGIDIACLLPDDAADTVAKLLGSAGDWLTSLFGACCKPG